MPKRPQADPNASAFNALAEILKKAESEGKDPLAVAHGQHDAAVAGAAHVDACAYRPQRLQPISPEDVQVGDWVRHFAGIGVVSEVAPTGVYTDEMEFITRGEIMEVRRAR